MIPNKLSSESKHYTSGTLSAFPAKKDTKLNLFNVTNNAVDSLRQTLAVNGKYIILKDASKFPDSGIIKVSPENTDGLLVAYETIFYGKKINDQLHFLTRGYGSSSPRSWPAGSKVSCPLMAEHHNAIKDAIIRIQSKIGVEENPAKDSITGILNYLENKWLSPKPVFKAFPRSGVGPLTVNFHNFSLGHSGRFLWDFGDGTTSTEKNPSHTYSFHGKFNVKLVMITPSGAQGMAEKNEYIEIGDEQFPSFFYATPKSGIATESGDPTNFNFVDQTDADVMERHWFFGDGKDVTVSDPNIHTVSHVYDKAGDYIPSLILRLVNNKTRRVFLPEGISVV